MKQLILASVASAMVLSGCGTVYISSSVPQDDPNVAVVALTSGTVDQANRSRYTPRSLPAAFFQTAGTGGGAARGAGALPDPVFDAQVRPEDLPVRLPPAPAPAPYEIGVGDVLLLATPAGSTVEELAGLLAAQNSRQGYMVQDDGAIAIPDVGRVMVAGRTLDEAEVEVFQALVSNQIDPTFTLEVGEFNSRRVAVGGAVGTALMVPVTLTGVTLEQALAAAGGIQFEDGSDRFASIRIYRDGQLYQIPLSVYETNPDIQKAPLVHGDSLFVDTSFELEQAKSYFEQQITLAEFRQQARLQALSELNAEVALRRDTLNEIRENFSNRLAVDAVKRDFVYLTGEVAAPGRFPLPFEYKASLADALFDRAGVIPATGNPSHIYVLRGQNGSDQVTAYNLNARNAANLVLATRLELRPNDIIFVAEQPVTRWNRVVDQITPSLINTGVAAASN